MCVSVILSALDTCDRLGWRVTKRNLRHACKTESMKSAEAYAVSILEDAARLEDPDA